MHRWGVILALVLIFTLMVSQSGHSLPVKKPLLGVRPGYVFIMPWEAVILTTADLEPLLTEAHERWEVQLAELRPALERYRLEEAADRLWAITEREALGLVGKPFPSHEEAIKAARCLLDGLVSSGIAITKQLIKRAQAQAQTG